MIYLFTIYRITIATTFLLSALSKVRDFTSFEDAVQSFRILPVHFVKLVSFLFLASEILIATFLFMEPTYTLGFFLSLGLLLVFSIAIVTVLLRNIQTSCNCFGPSYNTLSSYDLVRNFFVGVICVAGLISQSLVSNSQIDLLGITFCIAISLVVAMLFSSFSDIAKLVFNQ
jgi:hypothetical protein